MKSEYLGMRITSAVRTADALLRKESKNLRIFARINESEIMPIFDIDELEDSLVSSSIRIFENTKVEKSVFWLDRISETSAQIRSVNFSNNIELGSKIEFDIKQVEA